MGGGNSWDCGRLCGDERRDKARRDEGFGQGCSHGEHERPGRGHGSSAGEVRVSTGLAATRHRRRGVGSTEARGPIGDRASGQGLPPLST